MWFWASRRSSTSVCLRLWCWDTTGSSPSHRASGQAWCTARGLLIVNTHTLDKLIFFLITSIFFWFFFLLFTSVSHLVCKLFARQFNCTSDKTLKGKFCIFHLHILVRKWFMLTKSFVIARVNCLSWQPWYSCDGCNVILWDYYDNKSVYFLQAEIVTLNVWHYGKDPYRHGPFC